MCPGFTGPCLEAPNVHDLIGAHQGESSSVEVNRDLQKGGGQSFMVGQPAIHEIATKVFQFGSVGKS